MSVSWWTASALLQEHTWSTQAGDGCCCGLDWRRYWIRGNQCGGQFRRDCCCYGLRNGQHRPAPSPGSRARPRPTPRLRFSAVGPLPEGAGGMALGATVLNVRTIGPAPRRWLDGQAAGLEALTHARNVEADVNVAMAELDQTDEAQRHRSEDERTWHLA